jgi:hypothetical protein
MTGFKGTGTWHLELSRISLWRPLQTSRSRRPRVHLVFTPIVQVVVGYTETMNGDRDLPPLPIRPPEVPVAESSRRHSHRSKDRTSIRDLATLILMEQSEHRETQREVSRLTEELRLANLRADDAERKVREATERLKSVNEARLELLLCEIIQSNRFIQASCCPRSCKSQRITWARLVIFW